MPRLFRLLLLAAIVHSACALSATDEQISGREELSPLFEDNRYRDAIASNLRSLGIGAAYYWGFGDFEGDYDYPFTLETAWTKLSGEGIALDDNSPVFNYMHALAGSEYYLAGRNRGLTVTESFWLSFGSSFIWEWLIEYQEVLAINDQVMTPIGGLSIGEFRHQMFEYLNRGLERKGFLRNSLSALINSDQAIGALGNALYSNRRAMGEPQMDHAFELTLAYDDRDEAHLGLELAFRRNDLGESGRFRRYRGPYFVRLVAEFSNSDNAKEDLKAMTEAVLWGVNKTKISGFNHERTTSTTFGLANAFDYSKTNYDERESWHATAHLLGPYAAHGVRHGDWELEANLFAYANMGMLDPYGLTPFVATFGAGESQTEVRNEGYFHTFGYSVKPGLAVKNGPYEMRADYDYHYFNSINGWDRFPDEVTNRLYANEVIEELRLSLGRYFTFSHREARLFIGVTHRVNEVSSHLRNESGNRLRADGRRSTSGVEARLRF